jgi:putative ABC transport system permease protein
MIRNYLKTALRNLLKKKMIAFINVIGLSTGIACFVLLILYSENESNFDKFNKNAPNIYRAYLWCEAFQGQPAIAYPDYSGPGAATLGEAMKQSLPDVEDFVRLQLPSGESLLRDGNKIIRANITWSDPSLFSVFSFPLVYGTEKAVLGGINDIVLTASKARELFGSEDVVGKTVQIKIGLSYQPFTVSGVARDVPGNSTVRFEVVGNFRYAMANGDHFTIGQNFRPTVRQTYLQLREGSTLAGDKARLRKFLLSYDPNFINGLKSIGLTWTGDDLPNSLKLQPLLNIHTDKAFVAWGFTDFNKIDPKVIWILLAIASGILLIACINFMTLAIGRSAGRSKEVGVRKVMGAMKKQLVFQFLTEAILLSLVSTIFGMLLAVLALPGFNQIAARNLHFDLSVFPRIAMYLVLLILIIGLIAGSYPALVLSGLRTIDILKNKVKVGGENLFTKSLITFQFVLSIGLIVATIVILRQTQFVLNSTPGFDRENVIAIDASESDPNVLFPVYKQAIEASPFVIGAGSAVAGLGMGQEFLGYSDQGLSADINIIDTNYIRVMGMRLIAGRNFDQQALNDSIRPMIINETMMRASGWTPENVIGKEIKNFQGRKALVIGVVKNFNYQPLNQEIKNQAFIASKDKGYNHFYVRIRPGNPGRAIDMLDKTWNKMMPGVPMKYSFVDQDLFDYYKAEQRWSEIVSWSSGISIFLACLGLFGLAGLAAINRTREIGVRKVMGASVLDIIALLSRDFMILICIAFLIASPLTWFFMNKWLEGYAYRTNIAWWAFAVAGIGAVLVAVLTITLQTIRAALASPIKSIRTE